MNSFFPADDGLPDMSDETKRSVKIAEQKLNAIIEAVEVIKGRVYRDDELQKMLSIQKGEHIRGEYIMLGMRAILQFYIDSTGELVITKLYNE